jgi:hypothetical protein
MKNNKTFLNYFFTVIIFISLWLGESHMFGQLDVNFQEMEKYLKTAKIVSVTPDENAGRTEPWIIILDDGKIIRKGFFKHVSQCRPHPLPDCYKYEIAAYELSKLLDIGCVPPTVEKEIEGIPGSLQLWIEGCELLSDVIEKDIQLSDPDKFHTYMLDCRVFENLIGCALNQKDILVNLDDCTVCRVDFSEAFSPVHQLDPELEVTHCSEKLYKNLVSLSDHDIRNLLKYYISEEEIEAVLVRKELMIEKLGHSNKTS